MFASVGLSILIEWLDTILRSSLYAHFSESLSGLATIRAYARKGLRGQYEYVHSPDLDYRVDSTLQSGISNWFW